MGNQFPSHQVVCAYLSVHSWTCIVTQRACLMPTQIAQQHGILLDPIYTMASWEKACQLLDEPERQGPVIMLHTGGLLGWQGLAQRFPNDF